MTMKKKMKLSKAVASPCELYVKRGKSIGLDPNRMTLKSYNIFSYNPVFSFEKIPDHIEHTIKRP